MSVLIRRLSHSPAGTISEASGTHSSPAVQLEGSHLRRVGGGKPTASLPAIARSPSQIIGAVARDLHMAFEDFIHDSTKPNFRNQLVFDVNVHPTTQIITACVRHQKNTVALRVSAPRTLWKDLLPRERDGNVDVSDTTRIERFFMLFPSCVRYLQRQPNSADAHVLCLTVADIPEPQSVQTAVSGGKQVVTITETITVTGVERSRLVDRLDWFLLPPA